MSSCRDNKHVYVYDKERKVWHCLRCTATR